MTDAEYAIEIYNWLTGNDNPEEEGYVFIKGIYERLDNLPERNRQILSYHFRDRMTYKKIGEIYGVTTSAMRNNAINSHRLMLRPHRYPISVKTLLEHNDRLHRESKEQEEELYSKTAYIDSLNRLIESLDTNRRYYDHPENYRPIYEKDLPEPIYRVLSRNGIEFYEDLFKFKTFEDMCSMRNLGITQQFEILKAMWNRGYTGWILETYKNSGDLKKEIARDFAALGIFLERPKLYIKTKKADS